MAGLVPAIHVLLMAGIRGCPGLRPGMTSSCDEPMGPVNENQFTKYEGELLVLKRMVGFVVALDLAILARVHFS